MQLLKQRRELCLLRACITIDECSASMPAKRPPSGGSALALSDPATITTAAPSNSRNPLIAFLLLFGTRRHRGTSAYYKPDSESTHVANWRGFWIVVRTMDWEEVGRA
jgi:hypothetical protein